MESLLPQEREIAMLKMKWKEATACADIVTQSTIAQMHMLAQASPFFFDFSDRFPMLITNVVFKYLGQSSSVPPVAPGLPGYQEFHCQRLTEILSEVSTLLQSIGLIVRGDYVPMLQDAFKKRNETITNLKKEAKNLFKKWENTDKKMKNFAKSIESIVSDIQMSRSRNDKQKTTSLCMKYVDTLHKAKKQSREMNMAYLRYLHFVQNGINKISEIDKLRSEGHLVVYRKFVKNFHENGEAMQAIYRSIQRCHSDWLNGFVRYIIMNGITRTRLLPIDYDPYSFDFDEEGIIKNVSKKSSINEDAPIMFAIALYDFKAQNKNELSIEKGQEVYLFEPPLDKWCLASNIPTKPIGYVPTNFLKIITKKSAVSLTTRLPSGQFMSLVPGELVIITEMGINAEVVTCRKLNGEIGKVYRYDLKIE